MAQHFGIMSPREEVKGGSSSSTTEPQKTKLSYRTDLAGQFEHICRYKVDTGRVALEKFCSMVKELTTIEETYANALQQLANKYDPSVGNDGHKNNLMLGNLGPTLETQTADAEKYPSPIIDAVNGLRGMLINRAEQGVMLADQLRTDVLSMLESMLQQHGDVYRSIQQDASREAYFTAESLIQKSENRKLFGSKKGTSMAKSEECAKIFDATKRAYIFEEEYRKAVTAGRDAQEAYDNQMGFILDALQDMEEKRGQCFRDAAMRMLVYQTSCIRNVQYDTERIFKTCEDVDPETDIQNFIMKAAKAEAELVPKDASDGGGESSSKGANKIRFIPYRELVPNCRAPIPEDPTSPISMSITVLRKIISTDLFDNRNLEPLRTTSFLFDLRNDTAFRHHFFAFMDEEIHRRGMKVFTLPFHLPSAEIDPGPENDIEPLLAEKKPWELLVQATLSALVIMEKNWEVWSAQHAISVCQRVQFQTSPDSEPEFLMAHIYDHPLWNRQNFWETLVCVTIAESWQKFIMLQRNKATTGGRDFYDDSSEGRQSPNSDHGVDTLPWETCTAVVDDVVAVAQAMKNFGIGIDEVCRTITKIVTQQCDHLTTTMQQMLIDILIARVRGPLTVSM